MAASNSSAGVMGKMLSPAEPGGRRGRRRPGRQGGDLFRKLIGWSLGLLALITVLIFLQSTPVLGWMVPSMAPLGPGSSSRSAVQRPRPGEDPGHRPARQRPRRLALPAHPAGGRHGRERRRGRRLLRASAAPGVPLTFRSGGTSLCGQAVTDGVLVDTRRNFRDIEVLDDGARVRVQPGVTVRAAQRAAGPLRPQARPRPGQRGGLHDRRRRGQQLHPAWRAAPWTTRYRTLESLIVVLPSRDRRSTPARRTPTSAARARTRAATTGCCGCAERVRDNADSVARIQQQFSMKNTMGYGLNSLLDFDRRWTSWPT